MKSIRPAFILSLVSWLIVFILPLLILARVIDSDLTPWTFFFTFFIVAIMASAVNSKPSKATTTPGDMRVQINGITYQGESLKVLETKDGKTWVFVDTSQSAGDPRKERSERLPVSRGGKK